MEVTATTDPPETTGADTIAVGLFEGESLAGPAAGLVDSGEAKPKPRRVAVTHADGKRWLVVGLGSRDDWDAEGARVAGAVAVGRAGELGSRSLAWRLPGGGAEAAAALV